MSDHFIINDAFFGKIKDLPINGEAIKHFINDVIYKHPNWNILLKNLSDLYVLSAFHDSEKYLKDGEKSWKEIMNKDEYNILKKNRYYIVSFMLIKEKNKNTHYIDFFDTIIRNNNFGCVMIEKYFDRFEGVNLVPQKIIQSSAKYWGKVLGFYVENIDTGKFCMYGEDIDKYIKDCELEPNDLDWKELYYLCDIKENLNSE